MAGEFPSGIVTIVFTDIEGSSDLWEEHRASFQSSLDEHNRIIRDLAHRWNGVEVKTIGDAFMLGFGKASDAVQWAVEAQLALTQVDWPAGVGAIRVRIGMHTGEPQLGQHPGGAWDYFGPAVNRAARIEAAGHGGQILISNATREMAQPGLPSELGFRDLAIHRLKGVGEERIWQVAHANLPAGFPPLTTLSPERHNLPLPTTPLIGRDDQIAEWSSLLRNPPTRMLTLTGSGGIGKTRSALQLAELCVDSFADGVWWVPLEEERSAEGMIQRISSTLRLTLQPQPAEKEQLARFLKERELLLVLDNLEQIGAAAQTVSDLLNSAAKLKCLATSRRRLHIQREQLVEVLPLRVSEAESLFLEHAHMTQSDFQLDEQNRTDVAELCRRLECVPLALELAASRIRGMTPREILARLDQQLQFLQTRSPDMPPRQRALRGAIDWSYELLTAEDQQLFAQLAVFVGGFSMAEAEGVCEAFDVVEGVMELLNHSLLRAEMEAETQQKRFFMLHSVRSYAHEKLEENKEHLEGVRQRHAEYYLRFAEERAARFRSRDEVGAVGEMEASFDNLRAATAHAEGTGRFELCARLAYALGMSLQRCGFVREAMQRVRKGLEAAEQLPEEYAALRAQLLRECASLHCDQLEWSEAGHRANEALALYEQLGNLTGMAQANNLLGIAASHQQQFAEARRCLDLAFSQYQQSANEVGMATVINNLGLVEHNDEHGDKEAAAQHFMEHLRISERSGDDRGVTEAANNLGVLAQGQGRLDEAREYYRRALRLDQCLRNSLGVARALTNLGEVAEASGEMAPARRLFSAAVYLFNKVGSPYEHYAADHLHRATSSLNLPTETNSLRQHLKDKSLDDIVNWALQSADL